MTKTYFDYSSINKSVQRKRETKKSFVFVTLLGPWSPSLKSTECYWDVNLILFRGKKKILSASFSRNVHSTYTTLLLRDRNLTLALCTVLKLCLSNASLHFLLVSITQNRAGSGGGFLGSGPPSPTTPPTCRQKCNSVCSLFVL